MKNAMSAVVALAVGLGLAAAGAQAQGTNNTSPNTNTSAQATAPTNTATTPATTPTNNMQATAPNQNMQGSPPARTHHMRMGRMERRLSHRGLSHRKLSHRGLSHRDFIKQAQLRLKTDGLYRGRADGIFGPRTRRALAMFERENGLRQTAGLNRRAFDRLMGSTTAGAGFGSSGMTNGTTPTRMYPPAYRMPNGAGGTTAIPHRRTVTRHQ